MTTQNSEQASGDEDQQFSMPVQFRGSLIASFLKGGIVGTVGMSVVHPLINVKIAQQQGKKLNFRTLYKNIGINLSSITPSTALQLSVVKAADNIVDANFDDDSSFKRFMKKCGNAFLSGIISSPITNAVESIMTQSSKNPHAKIDVSKLLWGFKTTATREGIFALGYMNGSEIMETKIPDKTLASLTSGLITAVISHPLDVIKTKEQTELITFTEAARNIYKNNGMHGFFRGLPTRTLAVGIIIPVMDTTSKKLKPYFG